MRAPPPPQQRLTFTELSRLPKRTYGQRVAELATPEECDMDGSIVGLAAVVLIFGIPPAAMYTFYRVRKLRTDERLAALARGVAVPMEPDLNEAARSRRWGILLSAASLGYIACCAIIGRAEPDAWPAAAFGVIPLAIGLGF